MRTVSAILAIALAATACGFAPQDEFTGQRAGDGVAPWKDLGPVQICLGNEFIGPPASSPGGMCSPSSMVAPPCVDDGDCQSRESCVCGSCTVQYCTVNSDCREGKSCSFGQQRCDRPCLITDDCPITDECFNNTCKGRCFDDGDCQSGEVCDSQNWCITDPCSVQDDCLSGELCKVQRIPRLATEPSVLARTRASEPRFTMWIELSDQYVQDERAIWRATSADGIHYSVDPATPVIDDDNSAHAPSVVRTASGYAIYYEYADGTALRAATSSDGIRFVDVATVLDGGAGNAAVRAPAAVVLPDNDVVVYYQIGDGVGIGMATGAIAGPLTTHGPVLTPADITDPPADTNGAQFWLGVEAVRSPTAAATIGADNEPSLRMWFSAYGQESADSYQYGEMVPITPTYSIGYASASVATPAELAIWPFNPVLDRVVAFTAHRSELTPAVVQVADGSGQPVSGYLLYYLDAETEGSAGPFTLERIGVAGNGEF